MAFADLKNDFVFRRIFATHPDILAGFVNRVIYNGCKAYADQLKAGDT